MAQRGPEAFSRRARTRLISPMLADASGDTKVPAVQKNKPSQLVFLVPNLEDGTYHLEVRAKMGSGTPARELRIGRLDSILTVLPT